MKIVIAGTGYVGLVTGVCLAEVGNTALCIDIDKNLLDSFNILTTNADNKNPFNYLETITDKQYEKAKKLVYENK